MNILGIRIDNITKKQARQRVANFLASDTQHTIFTPNPEMLVDAQKDHEFKTILNNSSLNLCDGKGIQFVSKEPIERISGVDFMLEICAIAQNKNQSIFLLGSGNSEVVEAAGKNINHFLPKLHIVGTNPGHQLTIQPINQSTRSLKYSTQENEKLIQEINTAKPSILFVGFGHNKQERWITENLHKLPSVKIAMGVGGSFDFIAGKVQRAPRWMQKIGVEWLWRLIQEPWRIKRIWKATAIFLYTYYVRK